MSKYYKLVISGYGGEYSYGIVKDNEDKQFMREAMKKDELRGMNCYLYDGNERELRSIDTDNGFYAYGPDCCYRENLTVSLDVYSDENCENHIQNIEMYISGENVPLSYFIYSNPHLEDFKNTKYNSDDLVLGCISDEDDVPYELIIELNDNEHFDWSNIYIGGISMNRSLNEDSYISEIALYIRDSERNRIIQLFNDETDSSFDEEDFEDVLEEIYSTRSESLIEILTTMEITRGNIEDQGINLISEIVIVSDIENKVIYKNETGRANYWPAETLCLTSCPETLNKFHIDLLDKGGK